MDPRYWGRGFWTLIFALIYKYRHDVEACKQRVRNVIELMPCFECREHALEAMTNNNVMSSKDVNYVFYFFVGLHNALERDGSPRVISLERVTPPLER
ncbi:ORF081 [Saltwater crocodilepox virus]|nr:IMV redox protein [Saltwater crocodilepox virus]AVD69416.1 IMV redox protein [Saltwater crocodilepox virus]QGT46520.1 ORF081 [Saltwater crocodilepox virus]QGT46736.1 ORF081 [Saltwater crocodilepox virus]QGT46952.1 ORF081 [Saltwater crocodilepox virus]